jgi:hypothetical protein
MRLQAKSQLVGQPELAKKLSYAQRMQLSMLLGEPTHPMLTPGAVTSLQKMYTQKQEPNKPPPKKSHGDQAIRLADNYRTPFQTEGLA